MKRTFTFLLMSLFLCIGTMWAQTEATRMTADQLNAVTERQAIAIECTQITNYNRYYNGTGHTPETGYGILFYWVPVEEGVAGTYYIMRGEGEGDYLQANNITTFGTVDNAAKFHAVKPYNGGAGVENFGGADCYYNQTDAERAAWVRLAFLDNSKWFNFNGMQYNGGTGVWTVLFVHDMSALADAVQVTYIYKIDGKEYVREVVPQEKNSEVSVPEQAFLTVESSEGTIGESDCEIVVNCSAALPFVAAADAESIDTWYYVKMHSNTPKYIQYLADQTYIEWTDAEMDETAKDTYTWAFVGNIFDGFKVVNKAAAKAMQSTADGAVVLVDYADASQYVLDPTRETSEAAKTGFCLRRPDGNNECLNASAGKVAHWWDNDAGSTFMLEVVENEPEVEYADETLINAFMTEVSAFGELSYDLDATWAALPAVLAELDAVTPLIEQLEAGNPVAKADVEAATATVAEAKATAVYYNETYLPTAKAASALLATLEEGSEGHTALSAAIAACDLSAVTTVAELETMEAALAEAVEANTPEADPNDYTSYIINAALATGDAWNTDGTKGISGGMVKVASESAFDFSQTITLPAGQYKMTTKAVYRYTGSEADEFAAIEAGTKTRLVNLYAETATYKYEAGVVNRYDGASDTDYAAGNGSVTVNGKFVPNSSSAVQAWFDNGQYVNELVFNVQEEGQVKIGLTRTGSIAGDYTNIGAWTLTRLGDAEADPQPEPEDPEEPETNVTDVTAQYLTNAGFDDASSWVTEGNVNKEAKAVAGWNVATTNPDWFYGASVGYGSEATINNGAAPATNPEGVAEGGALGISVGWGCIVEYTQDVVLPAGVYTLAYKAINVNDAATQAANYFGFKSSTASYYGKTTSFAANTWVNDSVTFVLKEETAGAISVGIGAISGGSGANAKLFIDGVSLIYDPELPSEELEVGDVTSRFLVNADFEQASPQTGGAINTPPGWTLKHETSGWLDGSTRKSENPGNDGSQCYNLWAGTVNLADICQTVALPAGKYKLTVGLYSDGAAERYAYATVGGNTIKSANANAGSWDFVSVEFSNPTEGEVTVGAVSKGWFQIDNVTLEYLGEVGKDDFVNAYNQALAEAQALVGQKMSAAAAVQLEATIAQHGSLTADNSIEELEAATDAILAEIAPVKASVNSYKVLAAGALPDNSLEGWTCTNSNTFHINTWSGEGASDGTNMVTPFIENWVANGSLLGNGKISYTLPGVDPGYYKASALIRVYSEAGNDISGASFFANDVKTDFATGKPFTYNNMKGIYDTYTAVVNVGEDGVLEFGVEINDPTFNWVSFKNVKIEYIGVIDQTAAEALKAKIPTTKYDAALAAEIEALVAAVDAGVTYENYLALSEKVAVAEASAAAYASNKLAIDAMFALMESTNVYTVEAYEAYSAKAEDFLAQYEAGTLTATVDNPATIHGWHASVDYDDMLLSSFGVKDFESNLYINTWSTEGEDDGSEFKVPFFEYWVDGDKGEILPVATKTATMEGLNPGQYYSVEAWVRVQATNGVAAADATGITLSVGEGEPVDITEGEAIGDTRRSHAVFTAYGYADAEGKLTINFNVLDGNNISWLSFKNLKYTEVPVVEPEYLTVVGANVGDVALVEGKATVESISTIDVIFDRPVAKAENAGWATLADSWGPTNLNVEVLEAEEGSSEYVVRFTVSDEFGGEFTAAGDYELNIPEGFIVGAEGANYISSEITATITIEAAPATPLTVTSVTVGEDVMEGFTVVATPEDMIKVNFDAEFYFSGMPTIVNAEGNDASDYFTYISAMDAGLEGNSYILQAQNWEGTVAPAGVYTITLSKASFMNMMQWKAPAEDIVLTVEIYVPVVEVEEVTLDKETIAFTTADSTVTLVATVAPAEATDQTITWSSSNEAVATVDAEGNVKSVANGTATITATSANGMAATCEVTVNIIDTAIKSINADANAVIYDIHGRRVTKMVKGFYIVNGKKVVIK